MLLCGPSVSWTGSGAVREGEVSSPKVSTALGLGSLGGMAETAAVLGSLWPEASVPSVLTHTGLPQLHLIAPDIEGLP